MSAFFHQIGNASLSINTILLFFKFLACIHAGNARVPSPVLASGATMCNVVPFCNLTTLVFNFGNVPGNFCINYQCVHRQEKR